MERESDWGPFSWVKAERRPPTLAIDVVLNGNGWNKAKKKIGRQIASQILHPKPKRKKKRGEKGTHLRGNYYNASTRDDFGSRRRRLFGY